MIKNLLQNSTVYLSGPIEDAPDRGLNWRSQLKDELEERFDLRVLIPQLKSSYFKHPLLSSEEERSLFNLKNPGNYDQYSSLAEDLRHEDLRLIDKSDFIIFRYFRNIRTCGSWEELFLANKQKKPIIVWCDRKIGIPGWLFGTISHNLFFETKNEIFSYLDNVNRGIIDKSNRNRWVL